MIPGKSRRWVLAGLAIAGGLAIFLLVKGCLSLFDENFLTGRILVFNTEGNSRFIGLRQYNETTYYSSSGTFTQKGFSYHYFLQSRDLETGKLIKEERLGTTKYNDVRMLGGTKKIWLFIDNKFSVHDPGSLKITADNKDICEINPFLSGKLPEDIRYVTVSKDSSSIGITAKNGILYDIDSSTLKASVRNDESAANKKAIAELRNETSSIKDYERQHAVYQKIETLEKIERSKEAQARLLEDIDRVRVNGIEGRPIVKSVLWGNEAFALLKDEDSASRGISFYTEGMYGTDRRLLYKAEYDGKPYDPDDYIEIKGAWSSISPDRIFLEGGFLVDPETLSACKLFDPDGFLVLSKKEIGDKSPLILSRVNLDGTIAWETELPITKILQIAISPDRLLILSNDGKKVSFSNQYDIFTPVDLRTGNAHPISLF